MSRVVPALFCGWCVYLDGAYLASLGAWLGGSAGPCSAWVVLYHVQNVLHSAHDACDITALVELETNGCTFGGGCTSWYRPSRGSFLMEDGAACFVAEDANSHKPTPRTCCVETLRWRRSRLSMLHVFVLGGDLSKFLFTMTTSRIMNQDAHTHSDHWS